jgi:hypothetical protein
MVQSVYNVSETVSLPLSRPPTSPNGEKPMRAIATRTVATLALAGILVGIGGCADQPVSAAAPAAASYRILPAPAAPDFSRSGSGEVVVGPEGGVVRAPGGATLEFPAGALSAPTAISLTPSRELDAVEIQPHGLVFPAGLEPVLSLPFDRSASGKGPLNVVYVVDGAVVEVLPTTQQGSSLVAPLHHFSLYAGAQG